MAKFAAFTLTLGLLISCSRDEPIKIPEALPPSADGTDSTGGDNAQGETPTDPDTTPPEDGEAPGDGTLPTPGEMNLPQAMKTFFSEPHEALGELASFYSRETGLWPDGWKTSAFATMALIDYMERTKTLDFTWILDNTFRKSTFIKDNYEDNAAWGIAWLLAYDLTKEARYLDSAKALHDQIMAGWDQTCGGGIYAKTDRTTKTAAANLLTLRLAAMLAARLPSDPKFQESTDKLWSWISTSPLIDTTHLVRASISTANCMASEAKPNTQNQGLMISALNAMIQLNSDPALMDEARSYALVSAMEFRDADGAFVEKSVPECKPCKNEEALFKGILIQSLIGLYQIDKDETWNKIINQNAALAWTKSKGTGGMIGYKWQAASDGLDSSRQTSGVLLLNTQITKALEHNYAFNGDTRTSANCAQSEVAAKAFDASASTKWCGAMINGINHLSVDLGAQRNVKTVRILHAGAGGESRTLNTKDFELLISSNGSDFTELATIRGNQSSISFHKVSGTGRYLRLRFTNPGADNTGRIYEMSVE